MTPPCWGGPQTGGFKLIKQGVISTTLEGCRRRRAGIDTGGKEERKLHLSSWVISESCDSVLIIEKDTRGL